jgi:hypothetical protein
LLAVFSLVNLLYPWLSAFHTTNFKLSLSVFLLAFIIVFLGSSDNRENQVKDWLKNGEKGENEVKVIIFR